MKKAPAVTINLLPKDPFLASPLGKLLQWALTVGRYLVIFTEMVVILSFASRFSLDRRITDLNGQILQKKIVIDSYGDLESGVRLVQKKIDSYSQVEQQQNLADVFAALSEITPQDVTLKELNIQPGSIVFSGNARSNLSLNLLVNNIQLSDKFSDVVVERIESGTEKDPNFKFRIRASTNKQKTAAAPVPVTPINSAGGTL